MSDQNTATFKVEDMECAHCVKTITESIKAQFPSSNVDVELDKHLVKITGVADKSALAAIITEAGYTPKAL